MKKLIGMIVFLSIMALSSSAFAQGGWANWYVKAVGPYESSAFPKVGAVDLIRMAPAGGGASIYFRLNPDISNKLLATALTAMSSDKPVRAFVEKRYNNAHWSDFVVMSLFMGDTVGDLQ